MSCEETELIGTWKSDASDRAGHSTYGDVTLKFGSDGTLLYIIHESDKDQIMRLTYRVEPGYIITDQPSLPRPERTEYELNENGVLTLSFGGRKSRYLKVG
ncbi:MAG: hypothetical protein ROO76_23255 [Terriglobia bacterium]|nr:hypothetical protein [Terriglobia bacterium]